MSDKLDFLITALDFHLGRGLPPVPAWHAAVRDYAAVHHVDDGRTLLQRAAERALLHAEGDNAPS